MADIVLTTTILSAKVAYFQEALLSVFPKDDLGLTDKEHIEGIIKAYLTNIIGSYWKEKVVRKARNDFVEDANVIK